MTWNNGYERKKFEARMKKQAEKYRSLGMSEEQIEIMRKFDLAQFNSDRRYAEHTQEMPTSTFEDGDEGQSPIYERFLEIFSVSIEDYDTGSRYGWIERIENFNLYLGVRQLNQEQIELITLLAFDGLDRSAIAKRIGVSPSAITQRFSTIEKFLEKFLLRP